MNRQAAAWLCSVVSGLTMLALMPSHADAQPSKLKLRVADAFPTGHYIAENSIRYFMDQVTRATGGAVEFEYYPAEQLGKAKDLLALTLSGVADIGYVVPSYVSDKMPLSAVAELPGLFPNSCTGAAAYWRLSRDGILAQKEYAPNGVRVLFSFVLAPYQIATKQKFGSLREVEGMKLRAIGAAQEVTLKRLKIVPVRMPSPEVHESMSRGTIDGAIFPYSSMLSYDLPVKYVTQGENFGTAAGHYLISEARWKTLPANVQKAMQEAGEATIRHGCAAFDKDVQTATEKLRQKGTTIVTLPAEDRRLIAQTLATVANEWAESVDRRGKPGSETLKAFREALSAP